jgi:galactokinase
MQNQAIYEATLAKFSACYGRDPAVVAYAPGRVEVLGNHTDYNEGFVLSAAIDYGTFFAIAPAQGTTCRLTAGDLMREVRFAVDQPERGQTDTWANYSKGVLAGLLPLAPFEQGFDALFYGNIPLGSGLSSSAALDVSTALAITRLYGIELDVIALAKIARQAEHTYAGVKCGLLDPISSLCGRDGMLVQTDFRTLAIQHAPLGHEAVLLICNTHAKHALVDGEYNQRRADCELAAAHFKQRLGHPVTALRDVSWAEWEANRAGLDDQAARRAAHPIGENERVLQGAELLAAGDLAGFGKLMFASHESSQRYFENSCAELDHLVEAAHTAPGVFGARLSGGGFGGSVVALVRADAVEAASAALSGAYAARYGRPCEIRVIHPSAGARVVPPR